MDIWNTMLIYLSQTAILLCIGLSYNGSEALTANSRISLTQNGLSDKYSTLRISLGEIIAKTVARETAKARSKRRSQAPCMS